MELQFSSFSILLTFLLFLIMVLKIGKSSKTSESTLHLPPGPWKLPLIGNLHQLLGSLPHCKLRDLAKKYGPLMHLQLGEVSTVVVSSPEVAKEVMKTHDVTFASRPHNLASQIVCYGSTDIAFSPCGDYWRQLRKICMLELLSPKRVVSFRSVREQEVFDLIKWIASKAGSPVNITDKVISLTFGIVSIAAFGKKCKDHESFISVLNELIPIAAGFNIADLFPSIKTLQSITGIRPKLERLHQESDEILESIISEHKRKATAKNDNNKGDEDLVDVLLKFQERGDLEIPITTDNIKAVIFDIFSAGVETSATTVNWAMAELMKNVGVMNKAQAEVREVFNRKGKIDEAGIEEIKFLKLVIKETLRLHPPAPLLVPRECGERCVINGFEIPTKTRLLVNAWAIGRDPEYWTEPESFTPERFLECSADFKGTNFEYIPFGAGRRMCPGMLFGLADVELPLAMLLYHFDWKLPNGMKPEDLDMTEEFGLTVRRKEDLNIIPVPHNPSRAA